MKYHIDTIPLWDAVKQDSECPLCILQRHNELSEAEKLLGAAVMDPDTRIKVNGKGFCKEHQRLLIAGNNRLGLALMMQSHLEHIKPEIMKNIANSKKNQKRSFLFKKSAEAKESADEAAKKLRDISESCILCDRVNEHMHRYADNFITLWKNDEKFREAFRESKGVCVEHIALLLSIVPKRLNSAQAEEFISAIESTLEKSLARQKEEIDNFCRKYDYRNRDIPWGNSKDAPERVINRLQGWCVGEEPHPDDRNRGKKY